MARWAALVIRSRICAEISARVDSAAEITPSDTGASDLRATQS